ncbi:hypothetical protein [Halomonas sp. AOP25-F1-15]|uniref:hypothetical protein n=1 Tax=Halomonas sp. AOP25-F1-15 TaxID=3457709 RepID=UPI0040331902
MSDKLFNKLNKLRLNAQKKGHFVVDAAASCLTENPESLDYQINLVGSLHETGALRNSLSPYWMEFRKTEEAWANRCITRLISNDRDYWAVAALLGCSAGTVVLEAQRLAFVVVSVRSYERYDLPVVHVATMAISRADRILSPLLEIGWDIKSEELVDCVRARAVLLDTEEVLDGSLVGEGSMTYFCRATLPHGSWRAASLPFSIPAAAVVSGASPNPKFKRDA